MVRHPGQPPSAFVMYGYAQGEIMAQILEAACRNGELTRVGLLEAFRSLADIRTDGLVPPLDYSSPGRSPAREVYVVRPDASTAGGLTQMSGLFAAPFASIYQSDPRTVSANCHIVAGCPTDAPPPSAPPSAPPG